jgi:16S rRNA (guanine527-N7)-methyltransferase
MTGEGMAEGLQAAYREKVERDLADAFRQSLELGFLGRMPIADQIDHALGFVSILEVARGGPPTDVIDLGTGGGLPGLVLASCWPDTRVVLMDVNERRTSFLHEVVESWPGPVRAEVLRGRAEELGRAPDYREQFECVTSRSFGLPAATAECGSSFLEIGGSMVISEPPELDGSERWPESGLRTLGLVPGSVLRPLSKFGYQVLMKTDPLDERFPRRVGVPVKRPIF